MTNKFGRKFTFTTFGESHGKAIGCVVDGCPSLLDLNEFNTCILHPGELSKNFENCEKVWTSLLENDINREGVIFNIGGGVITDMGAFCASIYKRGISFIQVPTSYLAMVDAAIGGKTAIDFNNIKNPIGTFADAEEIYICKDFLKTLPQIELINGYAETIKHALIASADLWNKIKTEATPELESIEESIQVKTTIVDNDPFEMGERKLLNFGHTIGHGIEAYLLENQQEIKHGEAVAIGMYCESYLSLKSGLLSEIEFIEIHTLLRILYPKKSFSLSDLSPIMNKIKNDKKANDLGINFTLLEKIGTGVINQIIDEDLILEAIEKYVDSY